MQPEPLQFLLASVKPMTVASQFTMVREVPHNRLTFDEAEVKEVADVVRSGQWAQGPRVTELERELARMAGVQYAVCVASGLSALRLALGALQISSGDSVLVPAYSCVALANACLSWAATPLPVEIEGTSWNISVSACALATAESSPKAIIAVNTFGVPADLSFCEITDVPVIEDCAHAFGLELDGCRLGGRSDIGILSFYATKLLGGGEGGAVLTNSSSVHDFVRASRDYSDQPPHGQRLNDKMTDLEAALVLAQLDRLPSMMARREALAQRYLDLLGDFAADHQSFRLPLANGTRVWYRFVVEMARRSAHSVVDALKKEGVDAALPVSDWRSSGNSDCPVADRAYRSLVSLPLYPSLTEEEQDHVVRSFLKVCLEVDGA
jgi:dTDP-4-amino-4,6-dideoxygalactose transaminase